MVRGSKTDERAFLNASERRRTSDMEKHNKHKTLAHAAQGCAAMLTGDGRYEVQHSCQQAGDAQEDDEQGRPNDPAL